MPRVRKTVSLHPETVQKVAKGEVKKRRAPRRSSRNGRVTSVHLEDVLDPLLVVYVRQNGLKRSEMVILDQNTILIPRKASS